MQPRGYANRCPLVVFLFCLQYAIEPFVCFIIVVDIIYVILQPNIYFVIWSFDRLKGDVSREYSGLSQ